MIVTSRKVRNPMTLKIMSRSVTVTIHHALRVHCPNLTSANHKCGPFRWVLSYDTTLAESDSHSIVPHRIRASDSLRVCCGEVFAPPQSPELFYHQWYRLGCTAESELRSPVKWALGVHVLPTAATTNDRYAARSALSPSAGLL